MGRRAMPRRPFPDPLPDVMVGPLARIDRPAPPAAWCGQFEWGQVLVGGTPGTVVDQSLSLSGASAPRMS
jgi:hypothetical protein